MILVALLIFNHNKINQEIKFNNINQEINLNKIKQVLNLRHVYFQYTLSNKFSTNFMQKKFLIYKNLSFTIFSYTTFLFLFILQIH